ncbi:MAG: hypothetical protein IID00_02740 [Chloroflexi bacterium]|nr:hypothetical protein [Chloroflexota bacterium]
MSSTVEISQMNLDESSAETWAVSTAVGALVAVAASVASGASVGADVAGCAAAVGETGSAWDAGGEVGVLSPPQAANIKTKTVDMIPNVQLRFNFILGTPEDKLGFQFPRFVF